MNEPKRRGRPTNAEIAARMTDTVIAERERMDAQPDEFSRRQALAYARRMWEGQSPDLNRATRLDRIRVALEAQGMSMEGVNL